MNFGGKECDYCSAMVVSECLVRIGSSLCYELSEKNSDKGRLTTRHVRSHKLMNESLLIHFWWSLAGRSGGVVCVREINLSLVGIC